MLRDTVGPWVSSQGTSSRILRLDYVYVWWKASRDQKSEVVKGGFVINN